MNRDRLLNVARALRESHYPEMFTMGQEIHPACGTPACAWGHYAARRDLQDVWMIAKEDHRSSFEVFATNGSGQVEYADTEVLDHFDIDDETHNVLFGPEGCGAAETPIEAAEYIEDFVRRHEQEAP